MKFYIKSSGYFSREEEKGAISLIVLATNQILFLNRSGKKLLEHCDEWVDLKEFVEGLSIKSVGHEQVYDDYERLLFELDAYSVAQLKERGTSRFTGCRAAELRDYADVSAFMLRHIDAPFSCAVYSNKAYYGLLGVYRHLKNQSERYLLLQEEGVIRAVISVNHPGRAAGYSVLMLGCAVLDAALSEARCHEAIARLTELAAELYREDCSKIRYMYMNARQDWLKGVLCGEGFAQTAFFPKEIQGERDVAFYDMMIPAG